MPSRAEIYLERIAQHLGSALEVSGVSVEVDSNLCGQITITTAGTEVQGPDVDNVGGFFIIGNPDNTDYRDWETDRKSTRLNSSHRSLSRMPSSA